MANKWNAQTIRRILVRGPNWVGDAVMCTPALQGIRHTFPQAEISLLARPTVAHLLRGHQCLDDVIVEEYHGQHAGLTGKLRLSREIYAKGFDLIVLFPNSFDAALTAFLARIPRRFGYATDGRSFLLTDAFPLPREAKKLHQVQYYQKLVRPLCPQYSFGSPILSVSQDDEAQVAMLLSTHGVSSDCVLFAVNPGSMYGGAKRWLPERFAEASDQLLKKFEALESSSGEVKCVIVGAPGEEALGQKIAGLMRSNPLILSGQTSIGVLKALIQRCRLFLTNDTGPMHMANALGVPVVAVFGPTDHTTTSPFSPGYVVVRTPVDCSPCLLRECPIDHRCMTGVTVEQVIQAAEQCLVKREDISFRGVQAEC